MFVRSSVLCMLCCVLCVVREVREQKCKRNLLSGGVVVFVMSDGAGGISSGVMWCHIDLV